ncbi:DUF1906 domain-containing protein [Streptomyces gobiensis]|uniref:DUF1906 domain-containing protein n=1 Tax=Streptomyces gobiensis TaxID=2875706 RepID=UPI001E632028|nr:DUF1906 domain-containing protein [Streptomyces gobiensis]UGY92461.1 DUF1906 domain-containing protein [Streptomyces gobiensis]
MRQRTQLTALLLVLVTALTGAAPTPPSELEADIREKGADVFTGRALDTCRTPAYATMRAWLDSPYRAIGVYFGGRGRACPTQPNLDATWVRNVDRLGWKVLPLYVGSQSPCVGAANKQGVRMDSDRPWSQGMSEGLDAVEQARAHGFAKGSPLYLDMEKYDHHDTACAATTLGFVRGWNRAVRLHGYFPGFYSGADSGVAHMEAARKEGVMDLPDVIWFARWRVAPSVRDEPSLDPAAWFPHRRIHQYEGDVHRSYGGHGMRIDSNMVDAPVAIIR